MSKRRKNQKTYAETSEAIAERFNRRFGRSWDGQSVRDHAYLKVNRCVTIRKIAGLA